jgi:tetratricopeptide (TPR) repeat protein
MYTDPAYREARIPSVTDPRPHETAAAVDAASTPQSRADWFARLDRRGLLVWILLGIIGLVYAPTLGHQFTNWDDPIVLTYRVRVRSLAPANVWAIWTEPHQGDFFPVTETLYALQFGIDEYNPAVFHTVSVLLHLACCGLMFRLGQTLGLRPIGAFGAALLFGLHPVHVETAAWIADQKDLLACLFGLLSVQAFIAHHRHPSMEKHFVAFSLGLLAILSKPSAVSLGATVFVVLLVWLNTGPRIAIGRSLPLLIAGLVFSAIIVQTHRSFDNFPAGRSAHLGQSLILIIYGIAFYLWKFVWPNPLLPDYEVHQLSWSHPEVWGALATVGLILVLAWRYRHHAWTWLALGWYLTGIAPVLRYVPVGNMVVADRYMYFPSVGLCLLVGAGFQRWVEGTGRPQSRHVQKLKMALSGAAVLGLSALTVSQAMIWKDSLSLWTYELKHQPDSLEALINMGIALDHAGRYEESVQSFDRVLELDSDSVKARYNKGIALTRMSRYDEALQMYTEVFALDDRHSSAHYNMANLLNYLGRPNEAVPHYQRALEIAPDHLNARRELGGALAQLGRCDEAEGFLESVLQLIPTDPDAMVSMSICRIAAGQYTEADRMLRQGFQVHQNHVRLGVEMVWLWATCPDQTIRKPKNAVKLATQIEKAVKGKDRRVLDALAAAQANNGQFERAVDTAQRALDAPEGKGGRMSKEAIVQRIQLYKENRPYRLDASTTTKPSSRINPPAQKGGRDQ